MVHINYLLKEKFYEDFDCINAVNVTAVNACYG